MQRALLYGMFEQAEKALHVTLYMVNKHKLHLICSILFDDTLERRPYN